MNSDTSFDEYMQDQDIAFHASGMNANQQPFEAPATSNRAQGYQDQDQQLINQELLHPGWISSSPSGDPNISMRRQGSMQGPGFPSSVAASYGPATPSPAGLQRLQDAYNVNQQAASSPTSTESPLYEHSQWQQQVMQSAVAQQSGMMATPNYRHYNSQVQSLPYSRQQVSLQGQRSWQNKTQPVVHQHKLPGQVSLEQPPHSQQQPTPPTFHFPPRKRHKSRNKHHQDSSEREESSILPFEDELNSILLKIARSCKMKIKSLADMSELELSELYKRFEKMLEQEVYQSSESNNSSDGFDVVDRSTCAQDGRPDGATLPDAGSKFNFEHELRSRDHVNEVDCNGQYTREEIDMLYVFALQRAHGNCPSSGRRREHGDAGSDIELPCPRRDCNQRYARGHWIRHIERFVINRLWMCRICKPSCSTIFTRREGLTLHINKNHPGEEGETWKREPYKIPFRGKCGICEEEVVSTDWDWFWKDHVLGKHFKELGTGFKDVWDYDEAPVPYKSYPNSPLERRQSESILSDSHQGCRDDDSDCVEGVDTDPAASIADAKQRPTRTQAKQRGQTRNVIVNQEQGRQGPNTGRKTRERQYRGNKTSLTSETSFNEQYLTMRDDAHYQALVIDHRHRRPGDSHQAGPNGRTRKKDLHGIGDQFGHDV